MQAPTANLRIPSSTVLAGLAGRFGGQIRRADSLTRPDQMLGTTQLGRSGDANRRVSAAPVVSITRTNHLILLVRRQGSILLKSQADRNFGEEHDMGTSIRRARRQNQRYRVGDCTI